MASCASTLRKPAFVAHCDWSMHPARRWMACAVLENGRYVASSAELVGEPIGTLIARLRERTGTRGSTLVGFDFPIGLPAAYARKANVSEFLAFLGSLQDGSPFFEVCETAEEIGIDRPFYPYAPGHTLRTHLEDGLGIPFAELLRACEHTHAGRPGAGSLFWTLGANQVGKAAITGWRDVLAPALRQKEIKMWPFHGTLEELLGVDGMVIAESYPAEYYARICKGVKGSKRDQDVRRIAGRGMRAWASKAQVKMSGELASQIEEGFTEGADDAFDAVVGLFGMIDTLLHYSEKFEPKGATVRMVEGWILGQDAV